MICQELEREHSTSIERRLAGIRIRITLDRTATRHNKEKVEEQQKAEIIHLVIAVHTIYMLQLSDVYKECRV